MFDFIGAHQAVDFICDHPAIKAISFVGSDTAVNNNILFVLMNREKITNKKICIGQIHLRARLEER